MAMAMTIRRDQALLRRKDGSLLKRRGSVLHGDETWSYGAHEHLNEAEIYLSSTDIQQYYIFLITSAMTL